MQLRRTIGPVVSKYQYTKPPRACTFCPILPLYVIPSDVPDGLNECCESYEDGGRCCVSVDGLCAEIRAVSYISLDTTPPWAPPYPRGRAYLGNHGSD